MATPVLDFNTLADNVAVPAGTTVTSSRVTLSPGRELVRIQAVGLTVAGAVVVGGTLTVQQFLQGPDPSGATPLVRANWYNIATFPIPPDGSMLDETIPSASLGAGLDINAGTTVRCQMSASLTADVYFTVVAIAGGNAT